MEDLTDQVEIVFHPTPGSIDPRDSTVIQLEPVDAEQPSTSTAAIAAENPFKIPGLPTTAKVSKKTKPLLEGGILEPMEVEGGQSDNDDEWEETLIYVDLDDIPSVQELFAVQPDDFLLSQSKRDREEEPKFTKPTRRKLNLKFYNMDDKNPILQIGDRFYMGKYEEPFGTDLFFREKSGEMDEANSEADEDPLQENTRDQPRKTVLQPLLSDPDPPSHPVFGMQKNCTTEYELVAKVHKVLKMTRRNVLRSDEEQKEASLIGNNEDQVTSVTCGGTPDSEQPGPSSAIRKDSTRLGVEIVPGIVVHPIATVDEVFVPKRTVDLNIASLSSASMSSKLKKRNNAYLKGPGPDATDDLKDGDNSDGG